MTDDAPDSAPKSPTLTPRSWFSGNRTGLAALTISVVALGLAGAPYLTGGDFGGRVRAYLLAHPQVLDEVVAARDVAARADRTSGINAAVARNPAVLAPAPGEPAFGPVDARVTVTEFFDYRCPYCKMAAPEYLKIMEANPDVRFVFREWPVLDQGEVVTSQYAARAALAAHAQGKYLAVHEALMASWSPVASTCSEPGQPWPRPIPRACWPTSIPGLRPWGWKARRPSSSTAR